MGILIVPDMVVPSFIIRCHYHCYLTYDSVLYLSFQLQKSVFVVTNFDNKNNFILVLNASHADEKGKKIISLHILLISQLIN